MPEDDDTVLVRRSLSGDTRAFESLVEKYQTPIYNTAFRLVQDAADAQDVTQSAFLKAYEKLSSFDPARKFFSWLYRIAVNESLNFIDHRKHREPLNDTLAAEEEAAEEILGRQEKERWVQEGLMQLKVEYRTVIVLKHLQGLSYTEISQILEISEKKVKSRLFSARMMLREILSRTGMDRV